MPIWLRLRYLILTSFSKYALTQSLETWLVLSSVFPDHVVDIKKNVAVMTYICLCVEVSGLSIGLLPPTHFLPSSPTFPLSTKALYLFLSWAVSFILLQVFPGLPCFLFSLRFQVRPCLVMFVTGFCNVCPIQNKFFVYTAATKSYS